MRLLRHPDVVQLFKYACVSGAGYLSILSLMYLCVDIAGTSKTFAYILVYFLAYVAEYFINLRYLFLREHNWTKLLMFLVHIGFFLGVGSLVFKAFLSLGLHYLVATIAAAVVLLPLRFLAHKYFVFR